MNLSFAKYHGAGNDFIMIDARNLDESNFNTELVHALCDRHFGVGSDGLILLLKNDHPELRMKYFNSDGKEGTMCGNGGRCFAAFVKNLGLIEDHFTFTGIDGVHEAVLEDDRIELKMIDVKPPRVLRDGYLLDTGSAHFVLFREDLEDLDVLNEGKSIRYEPRFGKEGTNVNFIRLKNDNTLDIRTYERGVENETLACGTGSVASAISAFIKTGTDKKTFKINTRGGLLKVRFHPEADGSFSDVWLEGPAQYVFKGEIDTTSLLQKKS